MEEAKVNVDKQSQKNQKYKKKAKLLFQWAVNRNDSKINVQMKNKVVNIHLINVLSSW